MLAELNLKLEAIGISEAVHSHLSTRIFHSDRNCDIVFLGGTPSMFPAQVVERKYCAASSGFKASSMKAPKTDRSGWGRSEIAIKAL